MNFSTHTFRTLFNFIGILLFSLSSFGTEYTVSSDDEFNNLTLVAGDVVTWKDGTYSDQQIKWSGQTGTASSPIILKAETPGGVIFTGSSKINFFGSYLIVDGFYWKGGEGGSNHIEFRRNGSNTDFGTNCTIRNSAFDNLFTEEPDKSRWIVLYGSNNVIENCSFVNKLSAGAAILVELDYNGSLTPGHIIRNNYFYNITPKDHFSTNSGDSEAIRIGVSSDQSVSAQVLVEGNYFQAADGENEIITNKSADNTFLRNTFRNCRGSLVLRHGAGAHIEGNFFLGEGKAKSGGIRVSDRDHVIINNYMQGLNNDGDVWNNGITLVGGGESSGGSGNGYQNVDNVTIAHNTIYDSDDPIFFNDRNSYDPKGIIAYNLIYSENGDIVAGDISGTGQGMSYEGNIFGGSTIGISDGGITEGNANFSASGETYKPSSTGIAVDAAGSAYSSIVKVDVEGITRPASNLDVGAHEVVGGTGSAVYSPITDSDVGAGVGACFLGADGNMLPECGAVGDYLTVSQVSNFPDTGGTKSAAISSNVSWTVSDDQDWISVTPTSGTGSENIDITVSSHTSTSSRTGTVTVNGTDVGERTISITQEGYVAPIDVTGVSIDPSTSTIGIGETKQLAATITPVDATNQDISFSSSNASVASVDTKGLVTAVAEGSATITVTTDDGGFTDTTVITVIPPSTGTNLALNKSVSGTGTPDGANVPANLVDGDPDSRWAVSGFPQSATIDLSNTFLIDATEVICYNDRAYQYIIEASVDGSAYTTIVDRSTNTTPGTNTSPITNTFQAVDARYIRITVSGAAEYTGSWVSLEELRVLGEDNSDPVSVTSVSLSPATVSLAEGETQQLTEAVSPSNATNQNVSYSSSNVSVATVNSGGLVTAVAAGSAIITVTTDDGDFTATSSVTVTAPISVTGVSLSLTTISLIEGETKQLTASISPSNATNQNMTFSSSSTATATVNESGLVTAIKEGTATVTVTTDDGSFNDTMVVTVSTTAIALNIDDDPNEGVWITNPANSFVKIEGAEEYHSLIVFDPLGRVMIEQTIKATDRVDVTKLDAGIYIFKLLGANKSFIQRVVKQ